MLIDMCLPKFDIYQSPGILKYLISSKNFLFDVLFEIYLVRHNIVSTEQSVCRFKKSIFTLALYRVFTCAMLSQRFKTRFHMTFSCAMLFGASRTTLPKVLICVILSQEYFLGEQKKTLCSVVLQAPETLHKKKILLNVLLILLGQHRQKPCAMLSQRLPVLYRNIVLPMLSKYI